MLKDTYILKQKTLYCGTENPSPRSKKSTWKNFFVNTKVAWKIFNYLFVYNDFYKIYKKNNTGTRYIKKKNSSFQGVLDPDPYPQSGPEGLL